jgi:hypothetical protein
MFPTWSDWNIIFTPKGLAKNRVNTILKSIAYVGALVAIIKLRRQSQVNSLKEILLGYIRQALASGALLLNVASSKL